MIKAGCYSVPTTMTAIIKGLRAWALAMLNVFPFPTTLSPSLLPALSHTHSIHGFSCLLTSRLNLIHKGPWQEVKGEECGWGIYSPWFLVWDHLELTKGHCFPKGGPFYPTLPLESRYNRSHPHPFRNRVGLQLLALIPNSPEVLNTLLTPL